MADTATQKDLRADNPILGMSAAIGAFFIFAVMNVFAKLLSETHHVIEIAFLRNVIAMVPLLIWIYGMNRRDVLVIKSSPRTVVLRSVIGTVSLAMTFGAYSLMPMADATAFLFTSSLLIPAFCFFFLKEHVGIYRWSAILVGFLGVCVMLQPSGNVNLLGAGVALVAAVMHASLQTILRSLGKTESPETITFYFVFIGTFVALIPMPMVFTMPTWQEVPYILGLGITGLVAQFLLSIAYRNAKASVVTVFNFSGIIWATTFGWMVWGDWPTHAILTGGAIVIASNVFIVYREQKLAKQAKAEVQQADGL